MATENPHFGRTKEESPKEGTLRVFPGRLPTEIYFAYPNRIKGKYSESS